MWRFIALALFVAPMTLSMTACGDESTDSSSSSSSSSSQSQTSWGCIGGSCECKGALAGTSCCNPEDCGSSDSNNCDSKCTN